MRNGLELPLANWLSIVFKIVNGDDKRQTAERLRGRILQLIEGTLPEGRRFVLSRRLPPLAVVVGTKRTRLVDDWGPSNEREAAETDEHGLARWMADQYADTLDGIIYALSADTIGARIRCCTWCDKFYSAKRNHRRPRQFCCTDHRRAFDHRYRNPTVQNAYVQKHRRRKAERTRARRENERQQQKTRLAAAREQLRSRR